MKILVLSTYRTGSTQFCKQLAMQHGIDNLDEYFHESVHPAMRSKRIDSLQNTDNWVVKLMPFHDQCADQDNVRPNPLLTLLAHADKVYCIMRKDLNAQVRSYWLTKLCGQLEKNHDVLMPSWHDEFETPVDLNDFNTVKYTYIHKGDEITVEKPWCDVIAHSLPRYRRILFDDIRWVAEVCNANPKIEIVYTEDLETGTKYQRPFVMPNSFPKICTGYTLEDLTVAQ